MKLVDLKKIEELAVIWGTKRRGEVRLVRWEGERWVLIFRFSGEHYGLRLRNGRGLRVFVRADVALKLCKDLGFRTVVVDNGPSEEDLAAGRGPGPGLSELQLYEATGTPPGNPDPT